MGLRTVLGALVSNIFFTSDTHYFHANFLKFTNANGARIRPFECVEEMNERMVEGWNSVVRDGDKVYHLGDVTFDYSVKFCALMSRLRGSKRLVLGNHDIVKGTPLVAFFKKVSLWRIFKEENFVCSHVPLLPETMRYVECNVHGHTHDKCIDSPRYINICVEQTNYTPVALEDIRARIASA